jgi:CheY-like chemotaxis protein
MTSVEPGDASTPAKWVLVVDDDEDTRDAMVDLLNEGGYAAKGARGGGEALAILRRERPCLVLVDFLIGDMNGRELLLRARQLFETEAPQFVFVTGANPSDLDDISGAILYKPLNIEQLFGVVAHHFA